MISVEDLQRYLKAAGVEVAQNQLAKLTQEEREHAAVYADARQEGRTDIEPPKALSQMIWIGDATDVSLFEEPAHFYLNARYIVPSSPGAEAAAAAINEQSDGTVHAEVGPMNSIILRSTGPYVSDVRIVTLREPQRRAIHIERAQDLPEWARPMNRAKRRALRSGRCDPARR